MVFPWLSIDWKVFLSGNMDPITNMKLTVFPQFGYEVSISAIIRGCKYVGLADTCKNLLQELEHCLQCYVTYLHEKICQVGTCKVINRCVRNVCIIMLMKNFQLAHATCSFFVTQDIRMVHAKRTEHHFKLLHVMHYVAWQYGTIHPSRYCMYKK